MSRCTAPSLSPSLHQTSLRARRAVCSVLQRVRDDDVGAARLAARGLTLAALRHGASASERRNATSCAEMAPPAAATRRRRANASAAAAERRSSMCRRRAHASQPSRRAAAARQHRQPTAASAPHSATDLPEAAPQTAPHCACHRHTAPAPPAAEHGAGCEPARPPRSMLCTLCHTRLIIWPLGTSCSVAAAAVCSNRCCAAARRHAARRTTAATLAADVIVRRASLAASKALHGASLRGALRWRACRLFAVALLLLEQLAFRLPALCAKAVLAARARAVPGGLGWRRDGGVSASRACAAYASITTLS
jgi:hypothetical protein